MKDKQHVESTGMSRAYGRPGTGGGPGYSYGGRYGAGAGYGSGVTTYEYQEGTLIVDLAESSKKELVWRATIVAILGAVRRRILNWPTRESPRHSRPFPRPKEVIGSSARIIHDGSSQNGANSRRRAGG